MESLGMRICASLVAEGCVLLSLRPKFQKARPTDKIEIRTHPEGQTLWGPRGSD